MRIQCGETAPSFATDFEVRLKKQENLNIDVCNPGHARQQVTTNYACRLSWWVTLNEKLRWRVVDKACFT